MRRVFVAMAVLLTVFAAGIANASIIGTVVEATPANTDNAAGGDDSTWVTTADNVGDGLWQYPQTSGHGSWDVFLSRDAIVAYADFESAPSLVTTISGLTPGGQYAIRLLFGSHTSSHSHKIQAGLSAGSLALYDNTAPLAVAGTLEYEDGYMNLYQPMLGIKQADGSGQIQVYVAMGPGGWEGRTLYDGLTYEAVPEPSAIALLAGAMFGLLAYAWRKRKQV